MYDLAHYFAGDVGASSHVGIDNTHPGRIVEMVKPGHSAWTQCGYNGETAAAAEQCGYASWSRTTWLNDKEPLLRNTAAWLAEESARWDIPLTDLSSSAAQGSGRGVCYHSELGSGGCGHSDPGTGYPLDVVLQWAREIASGAQPIAPPEDEVTPADIQAIADAVWNKMYNSFVFTNTDGSKKPEPCSVPLFQAEKYSYLTWKGLTDAGAIRSEDPDE
jgi:hypothetical protein